MTGVRLSGAALEKRYGRVAALRGIDFAIEPGEAIAILGANGAGKSSLLRILAGLSRPSGGREAMKPKQWRAERSSNRRALLGTGS